MKRRLNLDKEILKVFGEKIEQLDYFYTTSLSVERKAKILNKMLLLCKSLGLNGYISDEDRRNLVFRAIMANRNNVIEEEVRIEEELNEIYSELIKDCVEVGLIKRFTVPTFVWEDEEE